MSEYWRTLDVDRGIWCRSYDFDGKGATANTLAFRGKEGELVAVSPSSDVTDAAFDELDRHGKVVALVAPNGYHHLGLPAWQKRYPDARAFAPEAAAKRIAKKQPDIRALESLEELQKLLPDDAWIGEPPGMKIGDTVAWVATPGGAFWYFNDLVMNLDKLPGPLPVRLLFKWTKSGPGFSVARLIVKFFVKDKPAFKEWLVSELAKHPPTAVLTGHGAPITDAGEAGRLQGMIEAAV